ITLVVTLLAMIYGCQKEIDNLDKVSSAPAPSNVSAIFDITTDNSGLVTIIPTAQGATKFLVLFGDDPYEVPSEYGLNEVITHVYTEGVYNVEITAVGISGQTSKYTQEL
ncbi:MAG: PKD domain protein, partial [Phototrophicales bacterium]